MIGLYPIRELLPTTTPSHVDTGVLRAEGLRWDHRHRAIVDGVDLEVHLGEIVGLLGPNGAGKTITLSMIAGLVRPTGGTIQLDGTAITSLPVYRRARLGLSYLPQERSVFRGLSALDNIETVFESQGESARDARTHATQLLTDFGLERLADITAARLSGGEQRRLEVARSLANAPRFLLFDEPFTGIDPLTIESLHAILVSLRDRGVGVLLTDHNVAETLSLCDRAYVLCDGRVLAEGTPAQLVMNVEVRERFLGVDRSG